MNLLIKTIFYVALSLLMLPLQAVQLEANNLEHFNVQSALAEFDQMATQFNHKKHNFSHLNHGLLEVETLNKQAQECIENKNKLIENLNNQLLSFATDKQSKKGVDVKYLENQIGQATKVRAQCRLLKIKTDEALQSYRSTLLTLQQEITFTQGDFLWSRLKQVRFEWSGLMLPQLDDDNEMHFIPWLIYPLPLIFLVFALSKPFLKMIREDHVNIKRALMVNMAWLYLSMIFIMIYFFSEPPFLSRVDNTVFRELIFDSFALCFTLTLFNLVFLLKKIPNLLQWYGFDIDFLKKLGMTIIGIYFIRELGLDLFTLFQAAPIITQLYETFILVLSISAMIYFSIIFYELHEIKFQTYIHKPRFIQTILFTGISLILLDMTGFTILAVHITQICLSILLIGALGFLLLRGMNKMYEVVCYTYPARKYLKIYFGYVTDPPYLELVILKLMAYLFIMLGLAYIFASLIGEVGYFFRYFFDYIIQGFKISEFQLIPIQWLSGTITFCIFILLSRYISTKISQSQQYEEAEEQTQVAFASIIQYIGFAISIIAGLLVAGFSFTSLAIIAGALSLGIGLGLQSIVNNFFSGLILLIEKPIKAGDRIKIDGIEGFVKKVRVRSTHILTPAQEDIIIPNSDLITHQVTNYMYNDTYWRVKCSVGIAYGSDTELVKKLLLEVADAHSEVIKRRGKEPLVLFSSFGDSALIFELWCLIKDVNKKYFVASELNFAIDNKFREHNITIAFPQLDIHFDKRDDLNTQLSKDDKAD